MHHAIRILIAVAFACAGSAVAQATFDIGLNETRSGTIPTSHVYVVEVPTGLADLTVVADGGRDDVDLAVYYGFGEELLFEDYSTDASATFRLQRPRAGRYEVHVLNLTGRTVSYELRVTGTPEATAPTTDEDYYVLDGGVQVGPLSRAAVLERIARGATGAADLVWRPGLDAWVRTDALPEFTGAFGGPRTPPPLPPSPPPAAPPAPPVVEPTPPAGEAPSVPVDWREVRAGDYCFSVPADWTDETAAVSVDTDDEILSAWVAPGGMDPFGMPSEGVIILSLLTPTELAELLDDIASDSESRTVRQYAAPLAGTEGVWREIEIAGDAFIQLAHHAVTDRSGTLLTVFGIVWHDATPETAATVMSALGSIIRCGGAPPTVREPAPPPTPIAPPTVREPAPTTPVTPPAPTTPPTVREPAPTTPVTPPAPTTPPAPDTAPTGVERTPDVVIDLPRQAGELDAARTDGRHTITIDRAGTLRVNVRARGDLTVHAWLIDTNGSTTLDAQSSGYESQRTVERGGLLPGTYHVRVQRTRGEGSYELETTLTAITTPDDQEPNDRSEDAQAIRLGEITTGRLGYGSPSEGTDTDDWFAITTEHDGDLRVDIDADERLTIHAWLIDTNGSSTLHAQSSGYESQRIVERAGLPPGRYYLRIQRTRDHGGYTIHPTLSVDTTPGDREPNDDASQAQPIRLGEITTGRLGYGSPTLGTDTDDWFVFTTDREGTVRVSVSADPGLSIHAWLIDTNGSSTLHAQSSGYESQRIVERAGLPPGRYYLRIQRSRGHGGYVVDPRFTPGGN